MGLLCRSQVLAAPSRARTGWWTIVLVVAFVVTPVVAMAFGAARLPVGDVFRVLASHLPGSGVQPPSLIAEAVVWDNRAPRVVAGMAIGAVLAIGGASLQAVTRNPLSDPYVLGVSSGASAGAAAAVVLLGAMGSLSMSATAFVGACLATLLVLAVGGRRHQSVLHLVLAGMATGFIFNAMTNLIVFSSDDPETARSVMFWMLGSLARCTWDSALIVTLTAMVMAVGFWFIAPWLDAIASGDTSALTVGVEPQRLRLIVTLAVSFAVAVTVSAAGGIGFVGLVVPHLCRSSRVSNHRVLIPVSALVGAIFLTTADALARVVFAPAEIPIGVVTGLVGAPILLRMVTTLGSRR